MKKLLIAGLAVTCAACTAIVGAVAAVGVTAVATEKLTFESGIVYQTEYSVGETLNILPVDAKYGEEVIDCSAKLSSGGKVLLSLTGEETGCVDYTFARTGDYVLTYSAVAQDGTRSNKKFNFAVGTGAFLKADLEAYYTVGRSVSLSPYVVDGDHLISAAYTVYDPNGTERTVTDGMFTPDAEGKWRAEFHADVSGKPFKATRLLYVTALRPEALFTPVKGIKSISSNVDAPSYAQTGNGVLIETNNTESSFRYANVIDLNSYDDSVNLIKILPVTSDKHGAVSGLKVQLIDIYDETNVVEYYLYAIYYPNDPDTFDWTYCFLNYNGIYMAVSNEGTTEGTVRTNYGAICLAHLDGQPYKKDVNWFEVQSNYAEKQFYVTAMKSRVPMHHMLLDLDDVSHVGVGNEWGGFTTGEVYLQVSLTGASTGAVLISEVCGQSLSGEGVTDRVAPSVIFKENFVEDMPKGVVGKKYPLLQPWKVLDLTEGLLSASDVSVKLYQKQAIGLVDISEKIADDGFVPTETGSYMMRYTARDSAGNTGVKDVYFEVLDGLGEVETECSVLEEVKVGERFFVPAVSVTNGMTTIVKQEVSYSFNGEQLEVSEGDSVMFEEAGTFRVFYSIEDYIGNKAEAVRETKVVLSDSPVLSAEGVPTIAIRGKKFLLPDFDAIDYNFAEGKAGRYPERSISVNGSVLDMSSRTYAVTEKAGERLEIIYRAGKTTKTFYAEVREPKYLYDYIDVKTAGTAKADAQKRYLGYSFDAAAEFTLINPLVLSNTNGIAFNLMPKRGGYTYFDIVLTDYYNSAKQIFFRILFKENFTYLQINGKGTNYVLDYNIYDNSAILSVTFNNISRMLKDIAKVTRYTDNTLFNGFEKNLAYCTFRFPEVTGESSFAIVKVSEKLFYSDYDGNVLREYTDIGVPQMFWTSELYGQDLSYGSTVTIPAAQAWQILGGRCEVLMKLYDDKNQEVFTANAIDAHTYKIESYGTWRAEYTASYANGMKQTYSLIFTVTPKESVEVAANEAYKSEYKFESALTVIEYTVSKNVGEATVYVTLISPDGNCQVVAAGERVNLTQKGEWKVVYSVYDDYNMNTVHYSFKVK